MAALPPEDVEDDAPRIVIDSLGFSDGSQVRLPDRGVVVFVGPNNSGKSQALRDIVEVAQWGGNTDQHMADPSGGKVVPVVSARRTMPPGWEKWFEARAERGARNEYWLKSLRNPYDGIELRDALHTWSNATSRNFSRLSSLFVHHADAVSRLQAVQTASLTAFGEETANLPGHAVYMDSAIEQRIDQIAQQSFGRRVFLDRWSMGTNLPFRFATTKPTFDHVEGTPTAEYLSQMRNLPTLESQGDGVKSFLGLLMARYVSGSASTFIDEPEAFLHPPQARLLGRLLAQDADRSQVFIATHSTDILQGILDAEAPDTTIIRITREDTVNHVSVLHSGELRRLWNDSLLKYSRVLDGLFHQAVVICEGDSDCRFYAAVADSLSRAAAPSATAVPETLFTYVGGKDRIRVAAGALRAVGVPTVVATDFDLLRDREAVRKLVQSLGFDGTKLDQPLRILDVAARADEKAPSKGWLREALNKALEAAPPTLDRKEMDKLRALLRTDTGWDRIKNGGLAAVPAGDATRAAKEALTLLAERHIFPVPVGELEGFNKDYGNHGPTWVARALEAGEHENPANTQLRTYVQGLLDCASGQRSTPHAADSLQISRG